MAEAAIEQPTTRPAMTAGPREARPRPARMRRPPAARVVMLEGAYLIAAGLWPVLHLKSFKKVTGPKLEGWLTKGVGACWANIGGALLCSGARGKVARELRVLGVTTSLTFAAMDFWFAGVRRRISPVYLVNGVIQLGFMAAWALAQWRENHDANRLPEAAFA